MSEAARVAIVGGGIVGSATALLLCRHARLAADDIVLFEREWADAPLPGAARELRVFALSPASIGLLTAVGAWQRLDATRIGAMERMRVWPQHLPADSPQVLDFDAAESGDAWLGAIVEARAVQAALLAQCAEQGVRIVRAPVHAIEVDPAPLLRGEAGDLRAALIVGADGARSMVREAAGIAVRARDYGETAIVANVRPQRPQPHTAFQRFLDTGPLAFLPLPGGLFSIVWSARDERAQGLLALDDASFSAELTRCSGGFAGELVLEGARASFPLRRLQADRYFSGPAVLVGDAAHVIHPLAGQGVNQGLGDARALAVALGARPAGESPAARRALRRYERERRLDNALMGGVVDALDVLFTNGGPLARVAGRGMALVGALPAARRALMRAAAGRSSPRR